VLSRDRQECGAERSATRVEQGHGMNVEHRQTCGAERPVRSVEQGPGRNVEQRDRPRKLSRDLGNVKQAWQECIVGTWQEYLADSWQNRGA
jgi:hypothetical protein